MKVCVKWDDFQKAITSSFGSLSKEAEFSDVTLVCEDGQQVEAHKVILAASSPLFRNMLQKANRILSISTAFSNHELSFFFRYN